MSHDDPAELAAICIGEIAGARVARPTDARVVQTRAQPGDGAPDATCDAEAVLEKLLADLADSDAHEALARASALEAIARVHDRAGDRVRARAWYRAALDVDPANIASLSALRRLSLEADDVADAARLLDREQRHTTDPRVRARLLVELAVLRRDRLDDARGSAHAFEEALAADPDNDDAALAVAEQHVERSEWSDAEPLLERLATRAARRPVIEQIAIFGHLGRTHLARGEPSRALEAFRVAQALGPLDLDVVRAIADAAFAAGALDEALTAQQHIVAARDGLLDDDDLALERACRTLIYRARSNGDDALEFELWHKIGVLYRDRLDDPRASLEAFRMASRLRPNDSRERRLIAELCAATDQTELAIAELREAIAREPMEVAHHQALYRLYTRTGELDRAFCVASVLVFLEGADAEQRGCYAELRPRGAPEFRACLGRGAWLRHLPPAELDRAIGGVFEVIARAARIARVRTVPVLASAQREDRDAPQRLAARAFFAAAAVLGLEAPQLWVCPDLPGAVTALPIEPIASLLGSTLLSGWSHPELMFVFGKHLTLHSGEHAVRAQFPSVIELEALLGAAIKVAIPSFTPRPSSAEAVQRVHGALVRELRPDERERLVHVVAGVAEHGSRPDVGRWMQCSDLTAIRAGLLMCGDLPVAAKVVRQEPTIAGMLSARDKLTDLVRFAVSDAHAHLRKALGIAVRSRSPAPDDDEEPTRERALCA